jgi:transposase
MNLKPYILNPTKNISLPIGTILAVQKYSAKLNLASIFCKFKKKGIPIDKLVEALISYKLTENLSISKASDWINREGVLEEFDLDPFEQRTLFRVLEVLGDNYEEIILDLQEKLKSNYNFEHTDVNMDWSSLILWGTKAPLGAYGYSRDHRPDKKQIMFGISELANPINIPIGLTIEKGNMNDQEHFQKTFDQVKNIVKKQSLITFDKGGNSKRNLASVEASKMKYLTAKKLNKSTDKWIEDFDMITSELVSLDQEIYGVKYEFPNRIDYLYFSKPLYFEQIESRLRKIDRQLKEAQELQNSIEKNHKMPKKFQVNNPLIDVSYEYQTKLVELGEEKAKKLLEKSIFNGREGFFMLTSNENLTLHEALMIYRKKDSVEKIMHSLKNEIEIKPLRVWSDKSIYGAILIGYIAQLIISLIRYDNKELKKTSTKFIKNSLLNLTVTLEKLKNLKKRRIYSNFDWINKIILLKKQGIG